MAELSGLKALVIGDSGSNFSEGSAEVLTAALPRLTALTYLALAPIPGMQCLPPELAALRGLQYFYWGGNIPGDAALPAGPWLRGLKRLGGPASLLANSLQQLEAASQLQELHVSHYSLAQPALIKALAWASHARSLKRVLMQMKMLPRDAAIAALRLQRRRPELVVELQ